MSNDVKYPGVHVTLTGMDGDAFAVLAVVTRAIRKEVGSGAAVEFRNEATSGDYDHLLATCHKYVEVN